MNKTYSWGMTPDEIIKTQSIEYYPIELVCQNEIDAVSDAVNLGIDSHLEAITERSTFEHFERTLGNGQVIASGLRCVIHPEELHVLLRRLNEGNSEEGESLRSCILSTLDIEEI